MTTMTTIVRRASLLTLISSVCLLAALAMRIVPAAAQEGVALPAPAIDLPASQAPSQVMVIAGGCFWGVQGVFQHVKGVTNAVSGYAGGQFWTADYRTVGTGTSGHAEAVRITYDPKQITYGRLLQIFFSVAHDPTMHNRQGPDVGPQYRSAIFPRNDEEAKIAKAYIAQLNAANVYGKRLATTVETNKKFYPAEDYHQDYMIRNPTKPYIVFH